MAMYVLSNIQSMRAQRYLGIAQRALNTTLERLASGKRINRAQDDAAGLLMSIRFTRSIQAWNAGANNLSMALDMLNTADSFTAIIQEDLQRLNELANQAANGMLSDNERALLNKEFREIIPEINRLAQQTKYLDRYLLTGLTVSVAAGEGSSNVVTVQIGCLTTGGNGLGIVNLSISSIGAAQAALTTLSSSAFPQLTSVMAQIGAQAGAFTKSIDATNALVENLTSARDNILLADLAEETTNLTNNQIVVQSGISALVQANAAQTLALALLGGGA